MIRLSLALAVCVATEGLLPVPAQARDCIGVVPAGGGSHFWADVEAGAIKAGQEMGVDIYFRGPKDEEHPEAQTGIIRVIEQRRCKALVLAPSSPGIASDVKRLSRAGIPTVYIDRAEGNAPVVGIVGTDNLHAGQVAAEIMAKALGKGGRVIVFRMKAGVSSTDQREQGFIESAARNGLRIVDSIYLGSDIGKARDRYQTAMANHHDRIDGIFTPNESTTTAVVMSRRTRKPESRFMHIGFDSSDFLLEALARGDLQGLVVQRPYTMGYRGVQLAVRAIAGKYSPPHVLDTGIVYLDRITLPAFLQQKTARTPAMP